VEACQAAKLAVLADGQRLREQAEEDSQPKDQPGGAVTIKNVVAPSVSAVCVTK
jgi:hypothetical protein